MTGPATPPPLPLPPSPSRASAWSAGRWTHQPAAVRSDGTDLLVEAQQGSDAWRHTAYGFVHDSEHGLLAPLPVPGAIEVAFVADYGRTFDQAGVLVRCADDEWVKAGVEMSDGVLQMASVVTHGTSDWSVAPVPDWAGRHVTVRASLDAGALVVRARVDDEPFRLVRVAEFAAGLPVEAGPYCCSPMHPGLVVRFTSWRTGAADASLH